MTQEAGKDAGSEAPVSPQEPTAEAIEAEAREPGRGAPATDSIADGVGVRSTYAVNLDVFEGPLDLLLHLVRRHELDVLDIPISFIAEKYIEYISFARSLDIEVAGEYLLMAATLAFLKSRELLPPVAGEDDEQEEEEDGVDPREELIRRLIEYERFRDAGFALAERPISGRDVFPRGGDLSIVPPEPGLAPVTLFRLAEAYNRVLDRAKINAEHEVVIERVTVRQRMRQLSDLLKSRPKLSFEQLFLEQTWSSEKELRQMLVVTLMSVLEMVKLGVLGVHQAQGSDALELERSVEVERLEEIVADFRGDDEDELDEPEEAPAEPSGADAELSHAAEAGPAEQPEGAPAEPSAAQSEPAQAEPGAVEQQEAAAGPTEPPEFETTPAEGQEVEAAESQVVETTPAESQVVETTPAESQVVERTPAQEPETVPSEEQVLTEAEPAEQPTEQDAAPVREQQRAPVQESELGQESARVSESPVPQAASDEPALDEPAPDLSPTRDDD